MWGRNQINIPESVQSAFVPNAFSVASARRDERESRESRPGGETRNTWAWIRPVQFNLLFYGFLPEAGKKEKINKQ